jgi:PadR family transcriptional regulator, regulatory protein AphA
MIIYQHRVEGGYSDMAVANKAKYAILGSLSLMPMSGYDIKKFSDGSIAHFWNENYARIYPVLKQMEKEGLVIKETMQTEGRPSRNVYSITDKGRNELDQWLLEPVEDVRPREELLLKLFFSEKVPVENLIEKINAEKEKCQKYVEEYLRIEDFLKTDERTKNDRSLPLWLATINYGKLWRGSVIKWCDETLKSLESMK